MRRLLSALLPTLPVLLVLTGSTVFVQGVAAQQTSRSSSVPGDAARLSTETASLRSALGSRSLPLMAAGNIRRPAAPAYDLVVLRVEFQPDTTRFTTGDGTFQGRLYSSGLEPSIDPLPHDAGYMEAHLAFLRDYVGRVSDGQTEVRTHLLPGVLRVPGKMGSYSPTGLEADSDAELAKLARLIGDAWSLADPAWASALPGLDPATTGFMIIHAGVGRDLELVGTILDKTPEDLPSLFFDRAALTRLDDRPLQTFAGIPVDHGIIVPRTETRQGFNSLSDEALLAEFSVNGLLAASFFNFLGVPDLFNTSNGESAIGPFGLMDGLGIFAYSGLFPPEPTAWTKYYLGWMEPTEMTSGQVADLTYVGDRQSSDAARASISAAEYFLVENRHRDPEQDGVVLQVWQDGVVSQVQFDNGAEGFNSSTVAGFPGGVVVSVDQYDFALPGGLDEDGGRLVGGALIWHVDERVMARTLADNRVNANPERRGLDLEEADSAQDIGNPTGSFFGPSFDLGSPFDFFYQGNPVVTVTSAGREISLYQNRFGPDTFPSSATNDGGPGFLALSGFPPPGPEMSVRMQLLSEAGLAPLLSLEPEPTPDLFSGPSLVRLVGANGVLKFAGDAGLLALYADGQEIGRLDGLMSAEPAIAGNAVWAFGEGGLQPGAGFRGLDGGGSILQGPVFDRSLAAETTTPVQAVATLRSTTLMVGTVSQEGRFYILSADGGQTTAQEQPSRVLGVVRAGPSSLGKFLADRAELPERDLSWSYRGVPPQVPVRPLMASDRAGIIGVVPDPLSRFFHILLPDGTVREVIVAALPGAEGPVSGTPALVDVDHDGLLDVLIADDENLWGITRTGAIANGFPIRTRAPVTGAPIVVEQAEDPDEIVILAMASDGQLDGYRTDRRRQADGFPLSVGIASGAGPDVRVDPAGGSVDLAALSSDGAVQAWTTARFGGLRAGVALGTEGNSLFVRTEPLTTTLLDTPEVLIPGETYNWPNPVREGVTRFRVFPTVTARISITILDAAGREVDRLELEEAPAEVPSELVWVTNHVETGVYFARVRAKSVDGRTEDRMVKVAVIR